MNEQPNFQAFSKLVIKWAKERSIIPNSTSFAQSIKTVEELSELQWALSANNKAAIEDAYGDILVTLIIGSELLGLNMTECLESAYNVIKDRKGYLREDGIFVKEE